MAGRRGKSSDDGSTIDKFYHPAGDATPQPTSITEARAKAADQEPEPEPAGDRLPISMSGVNTEAQRQDTDKALRRLALAGDRQTTWVNVSEVLGGDRKTPEGEPWKILMVTDQSYAEREYFTSLTNYADVCREANRWILLHNGWHINGQLIPQPGDTKQKTFGKVEYQPALHAVTEDPGAEPQMVPYTDDQGNPLFKVSVQPVTEIVECAFFDAVPAALVGWFMTEVWSRSQTLPNLTNRSSLNI